MHSKVSRSLACVSEKTIQVIPRLRGPCGASVAEDFGAAVASINPEKVLRMQEERFEVVSNNADYEGILKLFNAKGVSESVGHFFGVDNKKYRDKVIGLLGGDWRDRLVEALRTYAPTLP